MNEEKTALIKESTTENRTDSENKTENNIKEAEATGAENDNMNIPDDGDSSAVYDSGEKAVGLLRKIFEAALCLIAVAVIIVCAVYVSGALGINAKNITRMMISGITGLKVTATSKQSDYISSAENYIAETTAGAAPESNTEISANPADEYKVPYFRLSLTNETPYNPDMDEILSAPRVIPTAEELYAKYGEDAPLVLIIHTHGTEGYADTADNGYRSPDPENNVIAVGNAFETALNENGITAIHSAEMFDNPDFNMAYYNASLEIRRYLEAYPSISYVIDIHRDSMVLSDGTYYAPTSLIGSQGDTKAAQLMLVVGTDYGGSGHVNWRDNLSLAARLQCGVMENYPTLMRDINLRSASFNQQYTSGSLLIEVGSCASQLSEAILSAEIFARQLAKEIIG